MVHNTYLFLERYSCFRLKRSNQQQMFFSQVRLYGDFEELGPRSLMRYFSLMLVLIQVMMTCQAEFLEIMITIFGKRFKTQKLLPPTRKFY